MKPFVRILVVLMILIPAAAALAQTVSFEVKSGEVITVYGNTLVVRMSTGEVKEVAIPADFRFDVDGQLLSVGELESGTMLSALIMTTKTPETVRTVKIKNAEVVKVTGSQLFVKQDGEFKAYSVPAGFTFVVDGKNVTVDKLRAGSKLTAEIVYTSERTVTEKDAIISGSAPAPAPAAAPTPAPVAAPAPEMPKTASNLPLIGLLGFLMLAAGVVIRQRSLSQS